LNNRIKLSTPDDSCTGEETGEKTISADYVQYRVGKKPDSYWKL